MHGYRNPFYRLELAGGDRDWLLLRLLLGRFLSLRLPDWWRRPSRSLLTLLADPSEDNDRLEELLRNFLRLRDRMPVFFLLLFRSLDGDRLSLLERLLLSFHRLLLGGDRLRVRDDDLLADLRLPRIPFGDALFEAIALGGDLERSRLEILLSLLLLFVRLLSFPLSLFGDLLEDRRGDMLGERFRTFLLPLGGDFRLEDRRGDLLCERLTFLSLPLAGDPLEDRRGDLLGERLIFPSLPLRGDLLEDR